MSSDEIQDEKDIVYQRSLAFRQAEKDARGAVGGEGEERAKAVHKEARSLWRQAADKALRRPP